jgi:hypothetical protein
MAGHAAAAVRLAAAGAQGAGGDTGARGAAFVPIVSTGPVAITDPAAPSAPSASRIEVRLAGAALRIAPGTDAAPLTMVLRAILLGSARLFADETTLPVLDPGRGRTKTGHAWAIARDGRPWADHEPPALVFHYRPARGKEHAKKLLGEHAGMLQCDGDAGCKSVSSSRAGGPTLAFCWAHVRREFFDLSKGRTAPTADLPRPEERVLRLWRRRQRALGLDRLAGANLQTERRRSTALLHRRPDPPGEWLDGEPDRRAHDLALAGIEKRLTVKPEGEGSGTFAYRLP